MRKTLLILCLSFNCFLFYGQTTSNEKTALNIVLPKGNFHKTDFYDLPQIDDIKCQVLIVTDVVKDTKAGFLQCEIASITNKIKVSTAMLDLEEIKSSIQVLDYLKKMMSTTPSTDEEFIYQTKDKDLKIELAFDQKKKLWTLKVNIKGTSKTLESLQIDNLISVMNKAKTLIEKNK